MRAGRSGFRVEVQDRIDDRAVFRLRIRDGKSGYRRENAERPKPDEQPRPSAVNKKPKTGAVVGRNARS
jgi:hypothetical protein